MTAPSVPARLALALDERAERAGGWPWFAFRGACLAASWAQGGLIGVLWGRDILTPVSAAVLGVGSAATWLHGYLAARFPR